MGASSLPLRLSGALRNTTPKQMFCRTAECKRECTRDSGVMAGHAGLLSCLGTCATPPKPTSNCVCPVSNCHSVMLPKPSIGRPA